METEGKDEFAEMINWLKAKFEMSTVATDKISVMVVRNCFDERFPGITNTRFGKIIRDAFPGVERRRDGGGYTYRPLRWRQIEEVMVKVDQEVQTSKISPEAIEQAVQTSLNSPEAKKSKIDDLEKKNQELNREIITLQDKSRKLKNMLANKRTKESNRGKTVRSDMDTWTTVNLIDPDDFDNQDQVKLIGEGSFGQCSLQRFSRTGGLVVYKAMRNANPDAVIREARVMQSLTSQRFPFIFGVQLRKQPYGIVMQFIGNHDTQISTTLCDVVASKEEPLVRAREAMTPRDWVAICQDITEGLIQIHDAGFLHNDLKSNNIVIKDKRAFIIDLGKACEVSSPPLGKKYSSFFSHIAPEVLQGSCFSKESDIFSLGRVFNFIRKHCLLCQVREIEKDCMSNNYVMRPLAKIVLENLTSILLHL